MRAFVTIGRLRLLVLVLALALLPTLACAQLAIDKRIALVVGNWQYAQSPLKNPQNDLADMETLLKQRLKFDEVIVQSNTDPQKLKAAIRSFGDALANATTKAPSRVLGLFYYTGHGVQSEGKNYLVPVGKRFESEDDIEADAVQVQFVLDRMRRAGGGLNVVVLDACRDFPLRRRVKSDTRGLARMQPPQGSLIAYATEADATAYDNPDERNGLFTKHLLQRLAQADQDLDKAFDQVSTDVYRDAKARNRYQVPEIMKKTWPPEPVYLLASAAAPSPFPLQPSRDQTLPGSPAVAAPTTRPQLNVDTELDIKTQEPKAGDSDSGIDWLWPADGKLIGQFSEPTSKGIDISGRPGEPVLAAAAGKVMYVGSGIRGYGNLIILKHSNGYQSAYGHNRKILVKENQSVKRGQKIAELGDSDADQPKLHFQILRYGKRTDPLKYLPPR